MGLDMYLKATKFVSGNAKDKGKKYDALLAAMELNDDDICDLTSRNANFTITLCYWRKADAIHKWFIDNCQNGVDDCRSVFVAREQLQELIDVCLEVLHFPNKAISLLPSTNNDYSEKYVRELTNTADMLMSLIDNKKFVDWTFKYSSSW